MTSLDHAKYQEQEATRRALQEELSAGEGHHKSDFRERMMAYDPATVMFLLCSQTDIAICLWKRSQG
jgi:hypothetical protein